MTEESESTNSTLRRPRMRIVGMGLLIVGIIIAAYGVKLVVKYQPLTTDAGSGPRDGIAFVYAERDRAWANEIREKQRAAAMRFVWSGIVVMSGGGGVFVAIAMRERPSPPSLVG